MEIKCQNPKCDKYFSTRAEKAKCCSSACYSQRRNLRIKQEAGKLSLLERAMEI